MKVAMVKHTPAGKVFWFSVPECFEDVICPGAHVLCDTVRGITDGVIIGNPLEEEDVRDVAIASGARFPLREIYAIETKVPIRDIIIPNYMACTKPRNDKIVKRLLEVYNSGEFNGKFNTRVVVDTNDVLMDGYSAYLVAKALCWGFITAIRVKPNTSSKFGK